MSQTGQALHDLRIFVAMPGTTMGPNAEWNNPDEIKQEFYEKICERATNVLERNVVLFIEKDKERSGDILASMYRECWEADVYIADLSGSNPNVYLELGARWALRNGVTIIVTQSVADLQFNVASARSFVYSKEPEKLRKAIEAIVRAIAEGLGSSEPDNPIREAVHVVIESRDEYTKLVTYKSRYESATRDVAAAYVLAGRLAEKPAARRECFQKAIAADPTSVDAWVGYITELRDPGEYDEAIRVAQAGIERNPASAALYAQLGLAYNKRGRFDDAVAAFEQALRLQPGSAEFISNLGGTWRRKAFIIGQSHGLSVPSAAKAREYYEKAWKIAESDAPDKPEDRIKREDAIAYALGNVARLDFVLANYLPDQRLVAIDHFHRLRTVCQTRLDWPPQTRRDQDADDVNEYYRRFDLADTYLLLGELQEGIRKYQAGIAAVPLSRRPDLLSSVADPLRLFLSLDVVGDANMRMAIQQILAELQSAQSASAA